MKASEREKRRTSSGRSGKSRTTTAFSSEPAHFGDHGDKEQARTVARDEERVQRHWSAGLGVYEAGAVVSRFLRLRPDPAPVRCLVCVAEYLAGNTPHRLGIRTFLGRC